MESIDLVAQNPTLEHLYEQTIWEMGFYKSILKKAPFAWVFVITYAS